MPRTLTEKSLRKSASYPHEPARVWAALTDPRALAHWLMPNDFKPVLHHEFQFRVDPSPFYSGVVRCKVLEIDPPTRMVWSWQTMPAKPGKPPHPPMRIAWTLSPTPTGCTLTLEQTGLQHQPRLFNLMMSMGWNTMLNRWLPVILNALTPHDEGFSYTPLPKPPNRGHHRTRTIPTHFAR